MERGYCLPYSKLVTERPKEVTELPDAPQSLFTQNHLWTVSGSLKAAAERSGDFDYIKKRNCGDCQKVQICYMKGFMCRRHQGLWPYFADQNKQNNNNNNKTHWLGGPKGKTNLLSLYSYSMTPPLIAFIFENMSRALWPAVATQWLLSLVEKGMFCCCCTVAEPGWQ